MQKENDPLWQERHFLKILQQIEKDVPFVVRYFIRCDGFYQLNLFHLRINLNFRTGRVSRRMVIGSSVCMLGSLDMKLSTNGGFDYEKIVKHQVMDFTGKSIQATMEELQKVIDE